MMTLSPRFRIAFALSGSIVGLLFVANALGMIPDATRSRLAGRVRQCESVALSTTALLARDDRSGIESLLEGVVQRDPELLSLATRYSDGRIAVEVGDHDNRWRNVPDGASTEEQITLPVYLAGEEPWGVVEFRFAPLENTSIVGNFASTLIQLAALIGVCSFGVAFYLLGRWLPNRDPSKTAAPDHLGDALNDLARWLLIVDVNDKIVHASDEFAELVGVDLAKLTGKPASSLAWGHVKESSDGSLPWTSALETRKPVSNVPLRVTDSTAESRPINVNCTPLLDNRGQYRSVIITIDDVTALEAVESDSATDPLESADSTKNESEALSPRAAVRKPRRIVSTLATGNPRFQPIIEKFAKRLGPRLKTMCEAAEVADYVALADQAHWLKGAGGTVGFEEFMEPAQRLEALANERSSEGVAQVLRELVELAEAIEVEPSNHTDVGPEVLQPN